jgi:two-component system cell cycle response regulator
LVEDELRAVRAEAQETEERLRDELTAGAIDDEEPFEEDVDTLTDPRTGLFSESFFNVALESRVAAARRHLRPVAVVLLEVVEGLNTDHPREAEAAIIAESITVTLREADTACRLRNGYFALLLEDTPENGAIWTVERIRRQLLGLKAGLTLWAGVACYPAHAFSTHELMKAADVALVAAKEWRQDRIEVATAALD